MSSMGGAARLPLPAVSAADFKAQVEAEVASLQAEAAELTGKDRSKDRSEKGKAIAALRNSSQYVDACRIVKNLAPVHGHFLIEATANGLGSAKGDASAIAPDEAAKLAAKAEQDLLDLEPLKKHRPHGSLLPPDGLPEDTDSLLQDWQERMDKLEAHLRAAVPTNPSDDIDELESIASEVVEYRERLKKTCGYRCKDLSEDPDLHRLEERLDVLAGALLPDPESKPQEQEETNATIEDLLHRERELTRRMVHHHEERAGLSPSEGKEVERIIAEVAELKAELRAQGFSEHEQDRDEEVMKRLVRLSELRQKEHHDKKHDHAKRSSPEHAAALQDMAKLRSDLEAHKRRLRSECGFSHKDFRQDPALAGLEERLSVLHKFGGA